MGVDILPIRGDPVVKYEVSSVQSPTTADSQRRALALGKYYNLALREHSYNALNYDCNATKCIACQVVISSIDNQVQYNVHVI